MSKNKRQRNIRKSYWLLLNMTSKYELDIFINMSLKLIFKAMEKLYFYEENVSLELIKCLKDYNIILYK